MARRGAEQQNVVGGFQCGARRKGAFDLSRAPLVFYGTQAEPQRLERIAERLEHRLHQIHVGFGMVVIAGLYRPGFDRTAARAGHADIVFAQVIVGDTQQIPFDFGADDARAFCSSCRGAK